MKYAFLLLLVLLTAASVVTWRRMPEAATTRPVLYWVTDANPAREDQIHLFHLWQVQHGFSDPIQIASEREAHQFIATQGRLLLRSLLELNPPLRAVAARQGSSLSYPISVTVPRAEMRLDTANADLTKRIIQGVSGVGGDVMDLWNGVTMRQLQGMGMLRDLSDDATRLGFGRDATYPAVWPEIAIPSADNATWRQFQFPCNVATFGYIANAECFERVGLPTPPGEWTVDAFERAGRDYVRRANTGGGRARFFFASGIDQAVLRRSFGASELNETMTASTLADPRSVAAMEKQLQWQDVDRIIPSAADKAGFSTDSGFGGQEPQLFNAGNYAMVWSGRYMMIQFRRFNVERVRAGRPPLKLTVSAPPYERFPNTNIGTRAAAVYAGGKHQDLAVLFEAYLASEEYNLQVVRDADALPPNPAFAHRPEYERPEPDAAAGIYPETEYGFHKPFLEQAETIAVASSHSPFVLQAVVAREVQKAEEVALNRLRTAADALADGARRIDAEIARNLEESPALRPLYDAKLAQQKRVDAMVQAILKYAKTHPDAPIPAELRIPQALLDNPFHRAFYAREGWTRDDAPTPSAGGNP